MMGDWRFIPEHPMDISAQSNLHLGELAVDVVRRHGPLECVGLKYWKHCEECAKIYGTDTYGSLLAIRLESAKQRDKLWYPDSEATERIGFNPEKL